MGKSYEVNAFATVRRLAISFGEISAREMQLCLRNGDTGITTGVAILLKVRGIRPEKLDEVFERIFIQYIVNPAISFVRESYPQLDKSVFSLENATIFFAAGTEPVLFIPFKEGSGHSKDGRGSIVSRL